MNRVGNSISTEGLRSHAVRFREHLVERLLSERNENGHWEGRLSHSALSTATAITALYLFGQHGGSGSNNDKQLIDGGAAWLVKHQNDDGGWGDTDKSYSNISTTALVWAALGLVAGSSSETAIGRCEEWLMERSLALRRNAPRHALASA